MAYQVAVESRLRTTSCLQRRSGHLHVAHEYLALCSSFAIRAGGKFRRAKGNHADTLAPASKFVDRHEEYLPRRSDHLHIAHEYLALCSSVGVLAGGKFRKANGDDVKLNDGVSEEAMSGSNGFRGK